MQLTTKTRLYAKREDLNLLFYEQGKFFRTVFNYIYWNKELPNFCHIDYLYQNGYHFGTRYANSLFLEAKMKAKLHQEEYCFRIKQLQEKLKSLEKQKEKLVALLSITNNKEQFLKTKTGVYWLNRKIEKISLKDKGVTFGTKALQRKLSLKQTTLKNWRDTRNNFIYAIGRGARKYGNDSICLFEKDGQTFVTIELERNLYRDGDKIKVKDKKYLTVPVKHHYLLDELQDTHKKTQRILLKKNKIELHTTIELEKVVEEKETKLGIDFNFGHLDYYLNEEVNGRIDYLIDGSSNQRKESLRKAIKQVCLIAQQNNVSINIENLNFNRTKNKLRHTFTEQGKQYNRMLSNLSYSQYEKMMEVECYKNGLFLRKVDPRNTSKQAIENGWDRHLGAARIIKDL